MATLTEAHFNHVQNIQAKQRVLSDILVELYDKANMQVKQAISDFVYKAADIDGHASKHHAYGLICKGTHYSNKPHVAPWNTIAITLPNEYTAEFVSLIDFLDTISSEESIVSNHIRQILNVSETLSDVYYLLNTHVHKFLPENNLPDAISEAAINYKTDPKNKYAEYDSLIAERVFTNLILKNII